MIYPHAFKKMLLGTGGFSTSYGVRSIDLETKPAQLAVINKKTKLTLDITGTPTDAPEFIIAQGTMRTNDSVALHDGYMESVKTNGINPKYVSAFYLSSPSDPVVDKIAIGQGTLADSCTAVCDTAYNLVLQLKGAPSMNTLNRNQYEVFQAHTGCCVYGEEVDKALVFELWKQKISEHPIYSQFVNAQVRYVIEDAANNNYVDVTVGKAAASKASVVFTSVVATDVLTINGLAYTAVSGVKADNTKFSIDTGDDETVIDIADSINNDTRTGTLNDVKAVASGNTLYLEQTVAGVAGDATTLVSADATMVVSNATFENGGDIEVKPSTWGTYTTNAVKYAQLIVTGAYVDTVFGDCSFSPRDNFNIDPLRILASFKDMTDEACITDCFPVTRLSTAKRGNGYAEEILRGYIQSKRYEQEDYSEDPRLREAFGFNPTDDITRSAKLYCYTIVHNIPVRVNGNSQMESQQFAYDIIVSARNADFEAFINKYLENANQDVALEVLPS